MAISPLWTIGYFEDVLAFDASAAKDTRLFMMPGMDHCSGGVGPSWVNYLEEIDKWVTSGNAPEQLPAFRFRLTLLYLSRFNAVNRNVPP